LFEEDNWNDERSGKAVRVENKKSKLRSDWQKKKSKEPEVTTRSKNLGTEEVQNKAKIVAKCQELSKAIHELYHHLLHH
jgi:hypothetical protein